MPAVSKELRPASVSRAPVPSFNSSVMQPLDTVNQRKMQSSSRASMGSDEGPNGAAAGVTTSLKIFRGFLRKSSGGVLDASLLVSPECYQAWLASRRSDTKNVEKAFQRSLSGHITGLDGRTPFTEEEEEAVLRVVRKKERWPCFKDSRVKYGTLGFRTLGFHERLKAGLVDGTASSNRQAIMYKEQMTKDDGRVVVTKAESTAKRYRKTRYDDSLDENEGSAEGADDGEDHEDDDSTVPLSGVPSAEEGENDALPSYSFSSSLARSLSEGVVSLAQPFVASWSKPALQSPPEAAAGGGGSAYGSRASEGHKGSRTGPKSAKRLWNEEDSHSVPQMTTSSSSSSRFEMAGSRSPLNLPSTTSTTTATGLTASMMPTSFWQSQSAPHQVQFPPANPIDLKEITGKESYSNLQFLISRTRTMLETLKDFGQLWVVLYGFARMRSIARGWLTQPTVEQANAVMEQIEKRHPCDYICIFDFTTHSHVDRIIAQNQITTQIFGGLSRHHGGFNGRRFLKEDAFSLVKTASMAFSYPGQEFHIRVRYFLNVIEALKHKDTNPTAPVMMGWFDVFILVDEMQHLMCERGRFLGFAPSVTAAEL